jgi:hypothetical protein
MSSTSADRHGGRHSVRLGVGLDVLQNAVAQTKNPAIAIEDFFVMADDDDRRLSAAGWFPSTSAAGKKEGRSHLRPFSSGSS